MTTPPAYMELSALAFMDTLPSRASLLWRKLQDFALVPVRHDVQRTVRPFVHAPNPAVQIGQEPLLTDHALVFQNQSHERAPGERRDEKISLPCRKKLPGVEREARGRDIW